MGLYLDVGTLRRGDGAFILVQTGSLDVGELLLEMFLEFSKHSKKSILKGLTLIVYLIAHKDSASQAECQTKTNFFVWHSRDAAYLRPKAAIVQVKRSAKQKPNNLFFPCVADWNQFEPSVVVGTGRYHALAHGSEGLLALYA